MPSSSQLEETFQLYWRLTGGTNSDWVEQYRPLQDYLNKKGELILSRHRFDFAMPHIKLAIEIQGIGGRKSGHTTMTGYQKDREKMRLAMLQGWTVVELTTIDLKETNIVQAMDEVREFIKMLEGEVYMCGRAYPEYPKKRRPLYAQRETIPIRQKVLPLFGEYVS